MPAAYLLLVRGPDDAPEVLLQLRGPDTSYMARHWATAAAGHVEAGESVFEGAAREAREELGITVATRDMTSLCAMHRTLPGSEDPIEQRVDFFLTTRTWAGEPSVQEPGKCLELGWFGLDTLPKPLVPHEKHLLALLASGHVSPVVAYGF